jgi:hypothetical protein
MTQSSNRPGAPDDGVRLDGAALRRTRLTFLTDHPLSMSNGRSAAILLMALDALLLLAMWPVVGAFALVTVVCGLLTSAALRSWHDAHPVTQEDRSWSPSRLPEINIGAVHVGGDFGGFLFLCASVVAIVFGVPSARIFVAGSLVCAAFAAWLLVRARRAAQAPEVLHVAR